MDETDDAINGEILVTARSKAESIQDVPMAITALTAEMMEQKSVQGMDDIARFTPGLSFESYSGGFQSPVIRGQAQTRVTALESNVATFYDGIYIPRSWAVDLGVASLDRVEVVKGPQSARYGRNAFAGAINYISHRANNDAPLSAEALLTVGSDERFDYGIKANLPLNDVIAVAGTYYASEFDGSWKNTHPFRDVDISPGTTGNIGGWDNESWSLSTRAEPMPGLVLEGSYTKFDIQRESNPNSNYLQTAGQLNCGNLRNGFYSLLCGEVPGAPDTSSADPRSYGAVTSNEIIRAYAEYEFVPNLTASYLFGRMSGNVDIANLTVADTDNCTLSCDFQNAPVGSIDYDSHEFRLSFDGAQIDVAAGGFLSKGDDYYNFYYVIAPVLTEGQPVVPLSEDPTTQVFPNERTLNTTLVRSAFAEVQWTSADEATRAGVEARYSSTELRTRNMVNDAAYERTFNNFTPRFTVERDLSPDNMLYASAAKGAKAGGFNVTAIDPMDRTFDEEENWTYEIGAKNSFLNNDLTFNVSAFYTDWSDIQINSPDPAALDPNAVNITLNLGNATVYGVEFDTVYTPDEHWTFDANFSYAHASYDDGTRDSRFSRNVTPCDDIVCSTTGDVAGNQVERTPRTKAAGGIQWGTDLPWENGYFFVRGDASWQDKIYATPANAAYIPPRTLVNARTGITYGNFDLSIWARNLFDESYVSNAYVVLIPYGNSYQLFYGERRTIGLTLKAKI